MSNRIGALIVLVKMVFRRTNQVFLAPNTIRFKFQYPAALTGEQEFIGMGQPIGMVFVILQQIVDLKGQIARTFRLPSPQRDLSALDMDI